MWGNTPNQIDDFSNSATSVRYCVVEGGWSGDGGNNLDADPLFTDPVNDNFTLLPGSPAIDAGHNWEVLADTADIDSDGNTSELTPLDLPGNPRFAADEVGFDPGCGIPVVVDMGAYEYQGDPFPVKYGDIDGDGLVGIMEFLFVIGSWGPCQADCCLADFDLDGDVGLADFCTVIENWG